MYIIPSSVYVTTYGTTLWVEMKIRTLHLIGIPAFCSLFDTLTALDEKERMLYFQKLCEKKEVDLNVFLGRKKIGSKLSQFISELFSKEKYNS
jgi:hypothetical protein